MGSFPFIAEVYMLCAGMGALFVSFTAVMGASHGHGGAGHGHGAHAVGHGGAGHSGGPHMHAGHVGHAPAHGVGHVATGHAAPGHAGAGHGAPGHGTASHTGSHAGTGQAPSTGGHGAVKGPGGHLAKAGHHGGAKAGGRGTSVSETQSNTTAQVANASATALSAAQRSQDMMAMFILTFCNPTLISIFVALFGSFGLILWKTLPLPLEFTLLPAAGLAALATKITMGILGAIMSRLFVSKTYTMESVIGSQGEVTVGINDGRMGEIVYTVGVRRDTVSAKAADTAQSFKRGDKVWITDLADGIALVTPVLDDGQQFDQQLAQSAPLDIQSVHDEEQKQSN